MTDITIDDLTNKTDTDPGTGIFDKLAAAVKLHLDDEYNDGKITGPEYATVFLGALQSTLQQSLTFLLSEQEASKKIELLDKQILEAEERIGLVIAQTAAEYEKIAASKAKTTRENILSGKQSQKVEKEIADQVYITSNIRPEEKAKLEEEVDLLQSRDLEQVAATARNDAESVQKIALMAAQTLGFSSDTKQKLLKQMNDTFAVGFSVSGTGTVPESGKSIAIDDVAQELLNDVGSTVTI